MLSLIGTYDWDLYFYLHGCSTHQNLMSCSRILNSIKGFKLKQLQWSNITTSHYTSSQSNTQSPASHQHSQSTIHVQTPTLNINAPHFQPNLHQAPPSPLARNNQNTNYHTNQQEMHTPPTQPFNTQLPQSFNSQVPPPYFPQYPPTNSPSANSTDSSILSLAKAMGKTGKTRHGTQ